MTEYYDKFDAPQFVDFRDLNEEAEEGVDSFFDVPHDLPTPTTTPVPDPTPSADMSFHDPDKENVSPAKPAAQMKEEEGQAAGPSKPMSARKKGGRSKNTPNSSEEKGMSDVSTYLTPGTSRRKSQVAYLNGRSLLVQNFDGITIITPNKTHAMETRMDLVINSPALALRTRSVQRAEELIRDESEKENAEFLGQHMSTRKHVRIALQELEVVPEPEVPEGLVVEEKGEGATLAAPPVPNLQPVARPQRVRHNAPLLAVHPAPKVPKSVGPSGPPSASRKRPAPWAPVVIPTKFRATAEMVQRFQKDTPERFHSKPANAKLHLGGPSAASRASAQQQQQQQQSHLTIGKSPFLSTKIRQAMRVPRSPKLTTKEQREQEDMNEIQQHQVRANPLDRRVLLGVPRRDLVPAKSPTRPEPFNLSKGNYKRKAPSPQVFKFKAQAVPKGILAGPVGVPAKVEVPLTHPQSPALRVTAKYPKRVRVETPGKVMKEVGHFGVSSTCGRNTPGTRSGTPNRCTVVQPFSFENRDRELQARRTALLKKHFEEEAAARNFHATKKPNFHTPSLPERRPLPLTEPHTPHLSSRTLGAKNVQKFQQKVEEETKQLKRSASFKARECKVVHQAPFQPVLPARLLPLPSAEQLRLNTERRAAERAKFDEMLRLKHIELEEHRVRIARLREEQALEEEAEARRLAEFKAQPVPRGSPMVPQASNKALTEPRSPPLILNRRAAAKAAASMNH